jgi:apolipoprotein N-acyltransferase
MSEPNQDTRGQVRRPALGADLIIPVLAAGLTIYFLVNTAGLVWEARANGTVIGIALLILVAAQLAKIARQVSRVHGSLGLGRLVERSPVQAQRLGLLATMTVFIATIPWVGTTLGLFLAMFTSMAILGVRDWRALFGVSFAVAAVVYLLFIVLLQSRLPVGPVETFLATLLPGGA